MQKKWHGAMRASSHASGQKLARDAVGTDECLRAVVLDSAIPPPSETEALPSSGQNVFRIARKESPAHVFYFPATRPANPAANIFKDAGNVKNSLRGAETGEGGRQNPFCPVKKIFSSLRLCAFAPLH
jgi:hypothetical protein